MNEFNAIEVIEAYEELRSIVVLCRSLPSGPGEQPEEGFIQRAITGLREAREACVKAEFDDAEVTIQRAITRLGLLSVRGEYAGIGGECNRAADDIFDELNKRIFLSVNPSLVTFLNNPVLLGVAVAKAFPLASHDIEESGNCLATGCSTAAVFHLMRVVEFGLRALCASLGLKKAKMVKKSGKIKYVPISYTDWETMLNQLHPLVDKRIAKIKRGAVKQKEQEFYYPVLQDIKAIRDAWRNHVMHSRAVYEPSDAIAVYGHVRRIMAKIAERTAPNEKAKPRV